MTISESRIPLLHLEEHCSTLVKLDGVSIDRGTFLHHALRLSNCLPDHKYALNICENRYHFLVAFAAALIRGQTNLLPPNMAPKVLQSIVSEYPDSYVLTDKSYDWLAFEQYKIETSDKEYLKQLPDIPFIQANHEAAIVFTSGSTGKEKPNTKYWGDLVAGAKLKLDSFKIDRYKEIVSTVPSQHMFGLETTIMLPLMSDLCLFPGRPFFPQDVCDALTSSISHPILITTPMHLRVCMESNIDWPDIGLVISATAPLSSELACKAESEFNCQVFEIYGCSEAGAVARRRTSKKGLWKLLNGLMLTSHASGYAVSGASLTEPVLLDDLITPKSNDEFDLLGRNADLIKIAGKRISLADVNHKLLSIEGVVDGVVFLPEQKPHNEITRLHALVVAPGMSSEQIRGALSEHLDSVFLPRPLLIVDEIPRNEVGKVTRDGLAQLIYDREVYG